MWTIYMHKKGDPRRSLNLDTLDWVWLGINLLFWGMRDRIWDFWTSSARHFGGTTLRPFLTATWSGKGERISIMAIGLARFIFVI